MPTSLDHLTAAELQQHGAALRGLGRSLLGGDGEDLLQDGWVAALEAPPPRDLRSWLAGTLRRVAASRRPGERRRRQRERMAARPEGLPSSADTAAEAEVAQRIAAAVAQLHEPYRSAVVLRFWHGLEPKALGQRLGVPANTARSRVQRGVEFLRAKLTREGGSRAAWAAPLASLLEGGGAAVASAPAAAAPPLLMVMKTKILLAAAVLAAAAVLWRPWEGESPPRETEEIGAVALAPPSEIAPVSPRATRPVASPERTPLPAAGETPVRVLVVDENDVPMADMPVVAFDSRQGMRDSATDASGRVTLLLPAGEHFVQADGLGPKQRPDLASGWATVEARGQPLDVRLVMERFACTVQVRVVDDLGVPLEGVRISRPQNTGGPAPESLGTDVSGAVLFTGLPPGQLWFELETDSLQSRRLAVPDMTRQSCTVARRGQGRLEYRLARLAEVRFVADGVDDADVTLWVSKVEGAWAYYASGAVEMKSGGATTWLPPGRYEVRPQVSPGTPGLIRGTLSLETASGEAEVVPVPLEPAAGSVSFTVVDERGAPFEQAQVTAVAGVLDRQWAKYLSGSTTPGGRYVLRGIPDEPFHLLIGAYRVPGYNLAYFGGTDEQPWLQLPGPCSDFTVVLNDAYTIRGRLLDVHGEPATGDVSRGRGAGNRPDRVSVGEQHLVPPVAPGTFEFRYLRPGKYPLWIGDSEEGPPDAEVEVGPRVTPSRVAEVVLRQRPK